MKRLVQNKKALSMALAAALAIAPVSAFAASNDIRGHWAERTITQWQDKGLIGGYQDGTFKPDKPATRAEFARIMNQALGLNHKGNVSFSDVSSSDWFYNDVAIAMGEQYTAGYPDGTFKPNEIITRAQAAVFIAKALGASGGSLASFKDASSIPAWAQGAVGGIVEKGYMSGYPDGTFRPNAVLTRAEAVSTLNRIMGVKPVEEETKKVEKDVVIDQSGTKLKDQTIEGNLTISEKVGKGNVTLSNVEIKGNLIIQGGGENSVYLDNTVVEGKTVMDKKNVRLELSGKTKLPNVEIKEACNLTTSNFSGEVKRISIISSVSDKITIGVAAEKLYVESKADLYITRDIDQVVVEKNAAGTKIEVGSNSKVSTLTADGKVSLNGKGKISTLEANVDGITYASDITITKTETAKGIDKPEQTYKNGTSGGSSSDSSSSSKKSVSAIAVTGTAVVGAKLTATPTPTAATGTYRWQKCDTVNGTYTNITGATSSTYTIATGDEGKYIRVVFSASGSYKGTQTSVATAAIGTAVVPSVKVTALAFTDTDTDASQMGGTVTWTAPTNVSNVTGYVVYASADGTTKGAKLGEVGVGTNQLVIPANTTYAAHIIVVAKNTTGEAVSVNYASVAVTDVVATATPVITGTPKAGDTTISGTCVDGATVAVSINGGVAAAATVTGTNWTITVPALVAGNTISVVATKAPHTASAVATATVAGVSSYKAVTNITGVPTTGTAGTEIDLTTAVVNPTDATNKTIVWSVKDAGTTGVVTGDLSAGKFTPATAGSLVLTATITNGATESTNYTQDVTITVTEASTYKAVTSITGAPTTGTAGTEIDLTTAVVNPTDATNKTIVWSVKDAGTTGVTTGALSAGKFTPATAGSLVLTATITNGATESTNYTQDVTITVANAYKAVTNITGAPTTGTAGTEIDLTTAVVNPTDATNKTIVWSVKDAGTTGVTTGALSTGKFTPATGGSLVLTATITNGATESTNYTQDVTITVANAYKAVTNITGAPTTGTAGTEIDLTTVVVNPTDATNKTIVWSVKDAGTTGVTTGALTTGKFTPATGGSLVLTATITNGATESTNYTQDVTITVANAYKAVTSITGAPITGTAGTEIDLTTAVVNPTDATNKTIVWSVKDAGTTGVTTGALSTGKFTPATGGSLVLTATITNGATESTNYTQDVTITVANAYKAVTSITGAPITGTAGTEIDLTTAVVNPTDATNKTIVWSVKDAGTTGVTTGALSTGKFTPATGGSLVLTATITNGATESTNYTQDVTITVA